MVRAHPMLIAPYVRPAAELLALYDVDPAQFLEGDSFESSKSALHLHRATPYDHPGRRALLKVISASEAAVHHTVTGHENIVDLYDLFEEPVIGGMRFENQYGACMELMQDRDVLCCLNTCLVTRRSCLSEPAILSIALQSARGLSHMHRLHLIHFDLKPENIFCSDTTVKVGDFGFSGPSTNQVDVQNVTYMAPEVATTQPAGAGAAEPFTSAVDAWSLGATLYTLAVGRHPFDGLLSSSYRANLTWRDHATLRTQRVFDHPALLARPKVRTLISKLMRVNPDERMTMDELIHHPYLEGADVNCLRLE